MKETLSKKETPVIIGAGVIICVILQALCDSTVQLRFSIFVRKL